MRIFVCDVCGKSEPDVEQLSSHLFPNRLFQYCTECRDVGLEPYKLIVKKLASLHGSNGADFRLSQTVRDSLRVSGHTEEELSINVQNEIEALNGRKCRVCAENPAQVKLTSRIYSVQNEYCLSCLEQGAEPLQEITSYLMHTGGLGEAPEHVQDILKRTLSILGRDFVSFQRQLEERIEERRQSLQEMNCSVCGRKGIEGVFSSRVAPVSLGYCRDCLDKGAESYSVLVTKFALRGGRDRISERLQRIIEVSLEVAGKTGDEFDEDIQQRAEEVTREKQRRAE